MWQFYIIRCLTFAHHSTEMQMVQVDTGPTVSKRYYVRETRFKAKETWLETDNWGSHQIFGLSAQCSFYYTGAW